MPLNLIWVGVKLVIGASKLSVTVAPNSSYSSIPYSNFIVELPLSVNNGFVSSFTITVLTTPFNSGFLWLTPKFPLESVYV